MAAPKSGPNAAAALSDLLYQMLETELGGEQVYLAAISCALNSDLKKEWNDYLQETKHHQEVVLTLMKEAGLDPKKETPGRAVVRHIGQSLVKAIEMAKANAEPAAAELVAAECVVLAETKDHLNWELLGAYAEKNKNQAAQAAYDDVEEDEDHHLYHTTGWCRELWIQFLGMPAVLPPPEEVKDVETAIGASRAEQQRDEMLKAKSRSTKQSVSKSPKKN